MSTVTRCPWTRGCLKSFRWRFLTMYVWTINWLHEYCEQVWLSNSSLAQEHQRHLDASSWYECKRTVTVYVLRYLWAHIYTGTYTCVHADVSCTCHWHTLYTCVCTCLCHINSNCISIIIANKYFMPQHMYSEAYGSRKIIVNCLMVSQKWRCMQALYSVP